MCVAFFTLEHPEYALILCSNRDEYLSRPTEFAHFHSFEKKQQGYTHQAEPTVLSGIDVRAGGTWLGLHRTGKLALLTNITEPITKFNSSRGHLVSSFLTSELSLPLGEENIRRLIPHDAKYAGFNLLLLAPSSPNWTRLSFNARYVTNRGAGGPITYRPLTDAQRRYGGLSNGIDGEGADEWPKLQRGLDSMRAILDTLLPSSSEDELTEQLFDLLTWRSSQLPRDRTELRNTVQVEPLVLSATDNIYATRLSTVVLIRRNGEVLFIERDRWKLAQDGRPYLADPSSQRTFRFRIQPNEL
ncbi:NRDE protein-domain-containing protein [Phlebopus sp. FC_14]|nr:NRDE protein-domain-containing protein [Phlebopus sp. FC_14]